MLLNEEKLIDRMNGYLIIVEDKKSDVSLNSLGLNNIINISDSEIESFVDKLSEKTKSIMLTDFDCEGENKKQKIYKFFDKIRFNHNLRLNSRTSLR